MPRKSIGDRPMTDAERQARRRAARAAGVPVIRTRRAIDQRSRARRWRDAVTELATLQSQYVAWLEYPSWSSSFSDNLIQPGSRITNVVQRRR